MTEAKLLESLSECGVIHVSIRGSAHRLQQMVTEVVIQKMGTEAKLESLR